MTDPLTSSTPAALIASLAQLGLCLLGLACQAYYWRRRHQPAGLTAWPVDTGDFARAVALTLASGVVVQTLLVQGLAEHSDTLWQLLVPGGGFQFGILLGALVSARLWLHPRETGTPDTATAAATLRPWLEGMRTFLAIVPLTIGASLLWISLLNAFGIDAPRQELIDAFRQADSPGPFLALTFVAVILAPLTEEIVFRGGLYRFMRGRTPRWVALLAPAAIFAALHANLASFLPLLVLGVLFALAYERSGRLIVPITAHALFNLNTILLVLCGADT